MSYLGGTERPYTGLQVNKDPGVWVVWAGCFLICVGLYVAFFMPHQRFWFRYADNRLVIAGHTAKGAAGFRQPFDALVERLRTNLNKEEN